MRVGSHLLEMDVLGCFIRVHLVKPVRMRDGLRGNSRHRAGGVCDGFTFNLWSASSSDWATRPPRGDQTTGLECEDGYAPEGAKRRYPAHFTSKLTDADAELQETLHWLMRAKEYGYIESKPFEELWNASKQVGRRLGSMLKSGDWS